MTSPQTILITGGASGLGRELALAAGKAGYRVAIADIHEARADETCRMLGDANIENMYIECDVRQQADLRRAVERVAQRWEKLDVMINNAGVASVGLFEMISDDDWQWLLDINLMGVVRGCRAAITAMKRQGHGHIINISSMAGLTPPPGMSSYNTAKAAVISLSESLYTELAPANIGVTVVCPSFFRSNLKDTLRTPDPVSAARFERMLTDHDLSAEEIAGLIIAAIEKKTFLLLPHRKGKIAWRSKRWRPAKFYRQMRGLANKLRR